jgi:cytochrome b6-f complex iron-sulfur subunit
MRDRAFRRYVDRLAGSGRRARRGARPDDDQAAALRTAIALRAGRPGSGTPTEDFQAALHQRLAAELAEPAEPTQRFSRRRLVRATGLAAASVAAGAVADRVVQTAVAAGPEQEQLTPNNGTWRTVTTAAALADGAVHDFDLGTVNGFVHRSDGHLIAVSGVCTHLGCRLTHAGAELTCPCHRAAFQPDGAVIRHQLKQPLRPLPRLAVRELNGDVQIYAP